MAKPGYYARRGRTNEAKIWYEPVKEKKDGPGRGNRTRMVSSRLSSVPQYLLFAFIAKRFNGNVSAASRKFGISQVNLFRVLSKGTMKESVIENIVSKCKEIDPSVDRESLFIPPKMILVDRTPKKKSQVIDHGIPVIRPTIGHVRQTGTSAFSRAIARIS